MSLDQLVSGPAADTSVRVPFQAFVVAQGDRLLRTAYLLTRDHALAEPAPDRSHQGVDGVAPIESEPEPYVRKILVNTYATWWRRRWNGEPPAEVLPDVASPSEIDGRADRADLWTALGRLPGGSAPPWCSATTRASPTPRPRPSSAAGSDGEEPDQPRARQAADRPDSRRDLDRGDGPMNLTELTTELQARADQAGSTVAAERLAGVRRRVRARRRRQVATAAAAVAGSRSSSPAAPRRGRRPPGARGAARPADRPMVRSGRRRRPARRLQGERARRPASWSSLRPPRPQPSPSRTSATSGQPPTGDLRQYSR